MITSVTIGHTGRELAPADPKAKDRRKTRRPVRTNDKRRAIADSLCLGRTRR